MKTKKCPKCGYDMVYSETPHTDLEYGCSKCGYGEDKAGNEIVLT